MQKIQQNDDFAKTFALICNQVGFADKPETII